MKRSSSALLILLACAGANAAEPALDECRQRIMDYAYFWDQADAEGFADLFTEDATLTLGGDTFSGRKAIVERMVQTPRSVIRHLVSTIHLAASGDGTATGVSYVTVFIAEPVTEGLPQVDGFALLGEYHDQYRITPDGCRISERKLVPVLRQRR